METQDEFFQYLEEIYEQQAHCLEDLKSYVGLPECTDPDLSPNLCQKSELFSCDEPAGVDLTNLLKCSACAGRTVTKNVRPDDSFDSHTTMNIFRERTKTAGSSLFVVTLEGGEFGVEFIAQLHG